MTAYHRDHYGDNTHRILEWLHMPHDIRDAGLSGEDLAKGLVNLELQTIGVSLTANVDRLIALSYLAPKFYQNGRIAQCMLMAVNVHLGRSIVGADDWCDHSPEFNATRAGFQDRTIEPPFRVATQYSSNDLIEGITEESTNAIVDLMSMQLVMAWTAYETLAADLWEACLNARPRLAYKSLGAYLSPQTEEEMEAKRKVSITIPLSQLELYDYDVKNLMGTVLRKYEKWNFASRRGIRDAYLSAFDKSLHQAIKTVLDDDRLRWLAAVRNATVHNAGKADHKYAELAGGHPVLQVIKSGDLVPITGRLCKDLVLGCLECCRDLLRFIDGWMASNAR